MADGLSRCEFFLVRYVPDALKEEFVNIGVVVLGGNDGFADLRFTEDWRRVRRLDPAADIEMLEAMQAELRERLRAGGGDRERILHVLRDSFSNTVQVSAAKACLTDSPANELARLAEMYLETRRAAGRREIAGRGAILAKMKDAFEQAGVWAQMFKKVPVAEYTFKGDPLKLDCGYRPHRNGVLKFFHAVPLAADVDAAKVLAFSYPQIREGIARVQRKQAELTAIVEDGLDTADEEIAFAMKTLNRSEIVVAATSELAGLAEAARREMV